MTDKYRIDSHKLMFHPKRVAKWQAGYSQWESAKEIYPIYLEISPTGICNHRCLFCAKDYIGYKKREIDKNILMQRITEMAGYGVKSIMFAGEGEPVLYNDLPEVLDLCSNIGIDTALTTNLTMFNGDNTENFLKNCSWIKASINAGTPENYAEIHRTSPNDFEKVIKNMHTASSIKKEKGYNCTLGVQILLLPDNASTVTSLAALTRDAGFEYLVVKPYSQHLMSNTTIYKDVSYSECSELKKELDSYNTDGFKVIFRTHTMKKLTDKEEKYQKCFSVPFFWAYIMSDGNVYACSSFLENEKFSLGNINEQSFPEIWQGERRNKVYDYVKSDLKIDQCRQNCRMDEINRYLWELKHPKQHVNFI